MGKERKGRNHQDHTNLARSEKREKQLKRRDGGRPRETPSTIEKGFRIKGRKKRPSLKRPRHPIGPIIEGELS